MKPDRIERAHLRDPRDLSHTIHRYPAPEDLRELLQRFWIPVWSVDPGRQAPQRVLLLTPNETLSAQHRSELALSGLDDIPLFAGPVREVMALVAREQRLLRLPLTLPGPATTWRLAPRKDEPAPSPWPGR